MEILEILEILLDNPNSFKKSKLSLILGSEELTLIVDRLKGLLENKDIIEREFNLLVGFICALEFEYKNKNLDLDTYIDIINIVSTTKNKACAGCGNKMLQLHKGFQTYIFNNLKTINNKYILPLPDFKSIGLSSTFSKGRLEIYSFTDLFLNYQNCLNEFKRMSSINNKSMEIILKQDAFLLLEYMKNKKDYFKDFIWTLFPIKDKGLLPSEVNFLEAVLERSIEPIKDTKKLKNLEIDEELFLKMYNDDKSLKEISKFFNCTIKTLKEILSKQK